jgi:hypothetical protein
MASLGECDSCGATPRLLHIAVAYGCEGAFCTECRGRSLAEDIDELEEMLDETPLQDQGELLVAIAEAHKVGA